MLILGICSFGQTTLISPTVNNGGFESGTTGWTFVDGNQTNKWQVDTGATAGFSGSKAAYISNSSNSPFAHTYTTSSSSTSFMYQDVILPAGETKINLSFKLLIQGEYDDYYGDYYDYLRVYLVPTTYTPTAGSEPSTSTYANNWIYSMNGSNWSNKSIALGNIGNTNSSVPMRLIFMWKNDSSSGTQPPAAIDDVTLISSAPGNFISIANGNWNAASTWDANTVPTVYDNATVDTGHTVNINASSLGINNLSVKGTLGYGTSPSSFAVNGNLNVNSGGTVNVYNGTSGKTLNVAGNIINDGSIDISVGSTTSGNLTLNGTNVQSVSGAGTFNNNVIRNLTFANTNVSIPNINWSINNIKVAYNLNMTGAKVNLGANKLTFGNNAAGNTLTSPVGAGFLAGSKFSRYWAATGTGSAISAGSDPSTTTSKYPFVNSNGNDRSMFISRTNATGAVAGELAVVYSDANAVTSGLNIMDGTYSITDRFNGNWSVSNEGTSVNASSYSVALIAPGSLLSINGNARVMAANNALGGTHQNGTSTPGAQRVTLSQTDLLAAPLYIGINNADIPFASSTNGNWNDGTTWNKGIVPSCNDIVQIVDGHIVTVNSVSNVSKNLTINKGGTLVVSSGDLTVGCTNKNNSLTNNGTLTVSGGTLNVNGNINSASGSTFNQSSGEIIVDGNNGGATATSVPSSTPIVLLSTNNINWTGGSFTIVDPHADTSGSNTFSYSNSSHVDISPSHTMKFGNGVSTDVGGSSTYGFRLNTFASSGRISFGNIEINNNSGTNRFVTTTYSLGIGGNLTVSNGSEFAPLSNTYYVGGNIINNGTISSTSTLTLSKFLSGSSSPVSQSQTISGSGVFRNHATTPTAKLFSLSINNTSVDGVTLALPLSVSGTLTLTSGKVNTSSNNLLTLGTATAAGTLSGGTTSAYINGPFARTIGTNTATSFIHYPVGKAAYAPIWVAPVNASAINMQAEAFDSNSGSTGLGVINLSASRRWEVPLVSGTFSTINVKMGDSNIQNINIPVQAPSSSGIYLNVFGDTSTYAAGTSSVPNNIQSTTSVNAVDYTGFLSYAQKDPNLAIAESNSNRNNIKVYPNPFTDVLNISDIKNVKSISVMDVAGRLVKSFEKPTANLQLSELNSGMYLVVLHMNDGTKQTVKAIKK
ncbi:T9SS type A sorting domain-containing protein [Chryseobacterium sp.]|uniref:T9SS type A sorting domain-containing protein n=1 Tax=Chryseobacterium sp. TaxID=1871047 RepID=UPI00289A86AF|nr:T9SS type A sorting domain-containing protein [Chryseobacterium sp.]